MAERTLDDLKHDLGLIVASAESDLDDQPYPDTKVILETLLYRLWIASEREAPAEYAILPPTPAPMVGRIDDCRLKVEHGPWMCGKPQAHR